MSTVVFLDTGLSEVTGGVFQSRIGREELGAQLVAACCEAVAGWHVRYLRPDSKDTEVIYSMIKAGPCDVLVFFPYTYSKWLADETAKLFKDKIPIIYGGYHAGIGAMAQEVLEEGLADCVIQGRGDGALPQLLQELEAGKKLPSQVVRGQSTVSPTKAYPLDCLPWPIRDEALMQDLSREPLPFMPPANLEPHPTRCVIIGGAMGCSSRCDYCSSWMISPRVLHRSPKNIVDEMVWLGEEYGPGLVYHFANPLFNASRGWVMELCGEMERRGPFPCICMPDFRLDAEMVGAMKWAGFYFVMLGLEFASNQLRLGRGKRPGDPAMAHWLFAEAGILVRDFLMLARLGMTRQGLAAEIAELEALSFRADQLRANFEVRFPGTKASERLKPGDVVLPYPHWTTEEAVHRTELSPAEWQEQRRKLLYNYHFSPLQGAHYARQIARFPELEEPLMGFLKRLDSSLV